MFLERYFTPGTASLVVVQSEMSSFLIDARIAFLQIIKLYIHKYI